ncbi:MAG: 30S ribosome-binding factor RbfA [Chloroflexi bacterium]|jgi:ribosome-binding factor A|nr:30S ribosome-binding factor RbfA [Chloroflexota bacterium]
MPSEIRLKRIQDQIKQVLTEILETKVNDPRLEGVYITDVSVDRELDYANIYVSELNSSGEVEDILAGLKIASGFLRYNLSQAVNLRVMPKLRFYWDETPERADRIEALLSVIRQEREALGEILDESEQTDAEENDAF